MENTDERDQERSTVLWQLKLVICIIFLIHFYSFCHTGFQQLGLTTSFIDRFVNRLNQVTLCFNHTWASKLIVLFLLFATAMLGPVKRILYLDGGRAIGYAITGIGMYFGSGLLITQQTSPTISFCFLYFSLTLLGYYLLREAALTAHAFMLLYTNDDPFDEPDGGFPPGPPPTVGPTAPQLKPTGQHKKLPSTICNFPEQNVYETL